MIMVTKKLNYVQTKYHYKHCTHNISMTKIYLLGILRGCQYVKKGMHLLNLLGVSSLINAVSTKYFFQIPKCVLSVVKLQTLVQ